MNATDTQQPAAAYPGPIHVWTDDTGNHYAAQELQPGKIGFYVYRSTSRDSYGTTDQTPNPDIKSAVYYALTEHYFNADALSWIENRELFYAARDQNPTPQRSLANAISYPERCPISDETRNEIVRLLTYRCRVETTRTIRHRLENPAALSNYGIYDRLQIAPTVSYCAGQDYPGEIRTIRELLIKN